jgi:dTDP-4-amino-4,6-dideoxygalactose transaminase
MIPVTKPFFPPYTSYLSQLKRIYKNKWLTNRGELVLELEDKIKRYLNIKNILITNNGTVPLQISLKNLGNCGEIITTPFSYVATTSAIVWESCKPVFVDIDPQYLTIDERKIENVITKKTTCILATHVFGNPCNVEEIDKIAKKYNLNVIYDGAHCFGVKYKGKSVFDYGDISTCSFHATKLFHTAEGGALFYSDKNLGERLYYSHNFGHNGHFDFFGLGINGKISELQAAMGLAIFPHLNKILISRKSIVLFYRLNLNFINFRSFEIRDNTEWNYSYFPIIFDTEELLLKTLTELNFKNIFPRRYFYPSLNNLPYVKYVPMPISDSVSKRILCLPIYHDLSINNLELIVSIINKYSVC